MFGDRSERMDRAIEQILTGILLSGFVAQATEWPDGWEASAYHPSIGREFAVRAGRFGTELEAWRALEEALKPSRALLARRAAEEAAAGTDG